MKIVSFFLGLAGQRRRFAINSWAHGVNGRASCVLQSLLREVILWIEMKRVTEISERLNLASLLKTIVAAFQMGRNYLLSQHLPSSHVPKFWGTSRDASSNSENA
jgi:hypothetical protein